MGEKTTIEWTDATWNPILGCSRVSEGCRHCYAETIAGRFGAGKETVYSGLTQIVNGRHVWTGQIKETKQLLQPLSWRKPKRVFVNSMSDLFHENVTDEQRDRIFAVMALCPQHTFQVLTKRPARMKDYCGDDAFMARLARATDEVAKSLGGRATIIIHQIDDGFRGITLPNVWLGVSVENQAAADERILLLLQTPAAVRFISAEPLLGPIRLDEMECRDEDCRYLLNALKGTAEVLDSDSMDIIADDPENPKLDWVICGGESGPGARPMYPDWPRSLRDQCAAAGVAFFFKQNGEWRQREASDSDLQPRIRFTDARQNGQRLGSDGGNDVWMQRVGKKVAGAGALLDGVEHKQFPKGR
jgi:protein gp37